MLKQTLIAAATAGAIGLGMVATAAPASAAQGSVQFGGPGWNVQIGTPGYGYGYGNGYGNGYHPHPNFPQKFCTPIVKKVKWWDRFGYPHWSQVVVGQNCQPKFPPKFPPNGNPGPFPPHNGPWNGPGNGPGNGPYGNGGYGNW
jgi:hypothetical protein